MKKTEQQALAQSFLFRGVALEQALPLLQSAVLRTHAKGACIYARGTRQHALGILLSGCAEVRKGRVLLNQLAPGDCFGVAGLFTAQEGYVSTIVAARRCEVLYLPEELLTRLFAVLPQTGLNYIRFLSERICFLNRKLDAFTAPSAESRVALYLRDSAVEGVVQVQGGYTALAKRLGLGRASLYRTLDSLEESGVISRCERTVTVLNAEALAALTP